MYSVQQTKKPSNTVQGTWETTAPLDPFGSHISLLDFFAAEKPRLQTQIPF